jgi:hypothetical protein
MKKWIVPSISGLAAIALLVNCKNLSSENTENAPTAEYYGGLSDQESWGRHLVTVSACHDCHSPKKMTAQGMELDSSLLLAGHIAGSPEPEFNKKEFQQKGLTVASDFTTWVGPWGTTYTANLTSDETGIGNWTEEQFMVALRKGKYKGLEGSRDLLPPMPWQMYQNFTDGEIKAIFAYLKSTQPVKNIVPAPLPPEQT